MCGPQCLFCMFSVVPLGRMVFILDFVVYVPLQAHKKHLEILCKSVQPCIHNHAPGTDVGGSYCGKPWFIFYRFFFSF